MKQAFTIPGRLCSLNEYVNAAHSAWKRTKLKQEQQARVIEAARQADIVPMEPPIGVRVTYYEGRAKKGQRVRDLDNVSGAGNKFILDALVEIGIVPDDSPANVPYLETIGRQAVDSPRIVVELEN